MTEATELERIRQQKQGRYRVRTGHCDASGLPRFTNRLIREDSPYLLQHAHNPVNWYPWGDEAFAAARAQNRPVFLSIGYATCHWCHVMEEESFDDLEVARALNDRFISIKVDREQRPDLDDHFMTGVQLISGQGGWPMSSFLTPEGKPFFAFTYLPKANFLHLLEQVRQRWRDQPEALCETGERVHRAILSQSPMPDRTRAIDGDRVQQLVDELLGREDRTHGGGGQAPKFPGEPQLLLLLDEVQRAGTAACEHPAWGYLCRALDAMLRGGIYDQVGGGFHRYATDAAWQVPHFEKMLYNQAQLALIYSRGWAIGGDPEYRRVATETLDYLLDEMRSPDGGFYAATDADSEGEEGRFFTWPWRELEAMFEQDDIALLEAVYGVTPEGNFDGRNILHLTRPLTAWVPALAPDYPSLLARLGDLKARLYRARKKRPAPLRDDKEITEWNAMAAIALAEAGRLFDRPHYIEAARETASAIWQQSEIPGELYRNRIHGQVSIPAMLADYGYTLQALLALYDATGELCWLDRAGILCARMVECFWDESEGGFFNTANSTGGPALGRNKMAMDSTAASGNAAALLGLVQLRERNGDPALNALIGAVESCFAAAVERLPLAFPALLSAVQRARQPLPATLCYGAGGRIRIEVRRAYDGILSVRLQIADGWHINAHEAGAAGLVGTELYSRDASNPLEQVEYPKPVKLALGRAHAPIALYQGEVAIRAHLRPGHTGGLSLELRLQACDSGQCLLPERIPLLVPFAPAHGEAL